MPDTHPIWPGEVGKGMSAHLVSRRDRARSSTSMSRNSGRTQQARSKPATEEPDNATKLSIVSIQCSKLVLYQVRCPKAAGSVQFSTFEPCGWSAHGALIGRSVRRGWWLRHRICFVGSTIIWGKRLPRRWPRLLSEVFLYGLDS